MMILVLIHGLRLKLRRRLLVVLRDLAKLRLGIVIRLSRETSLLIQNNLSSCGRCTVDERFHSNNQQLPVDPTQQHPPWYWEHSSMAWYELHQQWWPARHLHSSKLPEDPFLRMSNYQKWNYFQ